MPEFLHDSLLDRRVLLAPERAARPGALSTAGLRLTRSDCPFCEGREDQTPSEVLARRGANSKADRPGWRVRVVPNLYPALRLDACVVDQASDVAHELTTTPGIGIHEIVVDSPRHHASLTELSEAEVIELFQVLQERVRVLRDDRRLKYVAVFKNVGSAAGATVEHAHCQLMALSLVPEGIQREIDSATRYGASQGNCGFCGRLQETTASGQGLIASDDQTAIFCPAVARLPFETWVVPWEHRASLADASESVVAATAINVRRLVRALEGLLPGAAYNMIICQGLLRPCSEESRWYHWRVEIVPRLSQPAGFEWGTSLAVNTLAPGEAAERLRGMWEPMTRSDEYRHLSSAKRITT